MGMVFDFSENVYTVIELLAIVRALYRTYYSAWPHLGSSQSRSKFKKVAKPFHLLIVSQLSTVLQPNMNKQT